MSSYYNIVIVGDGIAGLRAALETKLVDAINQLGVRLEHVRFWKPEEVPLVPRNQPIVAVFIAPSSQYIDIEAVNQLDRLGAPIIPVVEVGKQFRLVVPDVLHPYNGVFMGSSLADLPKLTSAVLEWLGLLRRQRRLFISYRQVQSRDAALRFYEVLQGAGFDVFLDTHEIRPGEDFQDVLMHRMTDCEILVLFDTPGFLNSRWTSAELAHANLLGIGILQIVWPGWTAPRLSPLAWVHKLNPAEVVGATGPLIDATMQSLIEQIEGLRANALAARIAALVGEFRIQAKRLGAKVTALPDRTVKAEWGDGRTVTALPTIGIPAADRYHDAFEVAKNVGIDPPVLLYDEVGVLERWLRHLDWLDQYLPIKTMKVADISKRLRAP